MKIHEVSISHCSLRKEMLKGQQPWTEEEDKILMENYQLCSGATKMTTPFTTPLTPLTCHDMSTQTWSDFSMFWRMANGDTGTQIIRFALISSILNCRRQAGVLWRRPPWRAHNSYIHRNNSIIFYHTVSTQFLFRRISFMSDSSKNFLCYCQQIFRAWGERDTEKR